jgi:hypothetical protein
MKYLFRGEKMGRRVTVYLPDGRVVRPGDAVDCPGDGPMKDALDALLASGHAVLEGPLNERSSAGLAQEAEPRAKKRKEE